MCTASLWRQTLIVGNAMQSPVSNFNSVVVYSRSSVVSESDSSSSTERRRCDNVMPWLHEVPLAQDEPGLCSRKMVEAILRWKPRPDITDSTEAIQSNASSLHDGSIIPDGGAGVCCPATLPPGAREPVSAPTLPECPPAVSDACGTPTRPHLINCSKVDCNVKRISW